MTTQDTRTAVEDAIKKAVPEIKSTAHNHQGFNNLCRNCGEVGEYGKDTICEKGMERPIGLEDVLRAINAHGGSSLSVNCVGTFEKWEYANQVWTLEDYGPRWHLGKSLSEQSDEVIGFLYSILCKV